MKNGLIITILFFGSIIASFSQSNYGDYPENVKKRIVFEDFDKATTKWTPANSSDNSASYKIKNGHLQITVPDKNMMGLQCIPVSGFNQNKNWEIETRIKYSGGSILKAFALIWGFQNANSQEIGRAHV